MGDFLISLLIAVQKRADVLRMTTEYSSADPPRAQAPTSSTRSSIK